MIAPPVDLELPSFDEESQPAVAVAAEDSVSTVEALDAAAVQAPPLPDFSDWTLDT
jgi:hypothetical protein